MAARPLPTGFSARCWKSKLKSVSGETVFILALSMLSLGLSEKVMNSRPRPLSTFFVVPELTPVLILDLMV
jgi:hypothetical protein